MDKTESAEDGQGKVQTAQIDLLKKGKWKGMRGYQGHRYSAGRVKKL